MAYPYPLPNDTIPSISRISLNQISSFINDSTAVDFLYPDILGAQMIYHHGFSKQDWDDEIKDLLIFCVEHKIYTMILFWDHLTYVKLNFKGFDWKYNYPMLNTWNPISEYSIGASYYAFSQPLCQTLNGLPPSIPMQLFASDPTTTTVPKITTVNSTCMNIIRQNEMRVYLHGPYVFNLSKKGLGPKLKKYLEFATSLGCLGVIFHCGKSTTLSLDEAYINMEENIIQALSPGLCPFLLETPAGQGTEMLCEVQNFVAFSLRISAIHPNFKICVDTCHVFSMNYCPYRYLRYCIENGLKVGLIHYNNSATPWRSRVDRHAPFNAGFIPWNSLEKVARLASLNNIDMVTE